MRSRSLLVVVLAATVLVGVGCGEGQARDATAGGSIDDVDTSVESTTPTTFAAQPPAEPEWQFTCAEPTAPIATADTYSGSQEQLPDVAGENVLDTGRTEPVDSDADGVADEIGVKNVFEDPATLTRGDGTFVFERDRRALNVGLVSDLDGDGRDEIGVGVFAIEDDGGPPEPVESWIVPGTTPPGTYDPADVGVRTGPFQSIRDLDGDGTVDLVAIDLPGGPTRFWSGAEIGAVSAPGDARSVEPFLAVPGALIGFADLGGDAPAIISGEVTGDLDTNPGQIVLYVSREAGIVERFTTAPEPLVMSYTGPVGIPEVLTSGEGSWIVLANSDRSSARAYLWKLDEPCAAPAE